MLSMFCVINFANIEHQIIVQGLINVQFFVHSTVWSSDSANICTISNGFKYYNSVIYIYENVLYLYDTKGNELD